MYKTPKFYGPQLLYQMVKVHFYFFIGKVLLLESYHKIMKAFPWILRIYRSIFDCITSFEWRSTKDYGCSIPVSLHTISW